MASSSRLQTMTKFQRAVAAVAVAVVILGGSVVAVRAAYGAFADEYQLVGMFPRAGQSLARGSDVQYRGVTVGEVDGVELVERQARVTVSIKDDFNVPEDVVATVRPKTLFGEKFIQLTFPSGEEGPHLDDGGELADARAGLEVEEFLEATTPLFDEVDGTEVATLITELVDASEGFGEEIGRSFDSAARATTMFADTIDAQLRALDSQAAFQDAIRTTGPDFNQISANGNLAMPEFIRARADFERVLRPIRPFADTLADILITYRPDIDTIFDSGDNVVRVLIAREQDISDLVYGLSRYVFKFSEGASAETLPDGTKFAYFKNFIFFNDIEGVICTELANNSPESDPFRELLHAGTGLDCQGIQGGNPPGEQAPAAATATGPAAAPAPLGPAEAAAAAQTLANNLAGALGTPDQSQPASVGVLVDQILGQP